MDNYAAVDGFRPVAGPITGVTLLPTAELLPGTGLPFAGHVAAPFGVGTGVVGTAAVDAIDGRWLATTGATATAAAAGLSAQPAVRNHKSMFRSGPPPRGRLR